MSANPDRHRLLTELFTRASARTGAARARFLDEACAGDAELRGELDALLSAEDEPHPWLDTPVVPDLLDSAAPLASGERIGRFAVEAWVGSGGAGDIYRARQSNPDRAVAIKLMRNGLTRRSALRRFELEAQLLARLSHPGIASVFEADVTEVRGRRVPYFVMEYVEGARNLREFVEAETLDTVARLRLFLEVCDAVDHGHHHGIVHCDLKPENVLVDASGRARVIDFGIARAMESDVHATTLESGVLGLAGTLPYMSPEQVGDPVGALDARSDVYALGALLFELLGGELPLDLTGLSIPQAAHAILNAEPRRLTSVAPDAPFDLEAVCSKALEKERARRYASVGELAADVRRFLRHEPVLARRPTVFYQLRKFARRHRGLVAGLSLAVAALVIGSGVAVQQAVLARRSESANRWLAYRSSIAAAAAALDVHEVASARTILDAAPAPHRDWEWRHLRSRLDDALVSVQLASDGIPGRPVFGVRDAKPIVRVARGARTTEVSTESGAAHDEPSAGPFDEHAATGLRVEVRAGELVVRVPGEDERVHRVAAPDALVRGLRLAPSAAFAVVLLADRAVSVRLADGRTSTLEVDDGGTGIAAFDVSQGGAVVLAAAARGRPLLWDPDSGATTPLAEVDGFVRAVRFDASGERVAAGLQNAGIGLWSARDGRPLATRRAHRHAVTAVELDDAAGVLFSGSLDRSLRAWSLDDLEPLGVLHGHASGIRHLALSPDGALLASTGEDGTLRLWNARGLATEGRVEAHAPLVFPVACSPDGVLVASGGLDGFVRLWDPRTRVLVAELPVPAGATTGLAFSPDGTKLVASCASGLLAFDLVDGARLCPDREAPRTLRPLAALEFLADSARVLVPEDLGDGVVCTWDTRTGVTERTTIFDVAGELTRFVDPDRRFAVLYARSADEGSAQRADSDSGAALVVYDLATRERLALPHVSGAFAFRPETGRSELAARLEERPDAFVLLDLASRRTLMEVPGRSDRVYDLAWSPSGTRLAMAARNGLRLWNTDEAGRRVGISAADQDVVELRGHASFIWSVEWMPDGACLVSGSGDGTLGFWDTRSFAEVCAAAADAGSLAEVPTAELERRLGESRDVAAFLELLGRREWEAR